ncbi:MAG: RHS repeat-associated core domain-containing protein [Bryobacteraceae bacterium]
MPPDKRGTRYFFGWHARSRARLARVPQHFTRKERDTESGLDFFGARYYGSPLGRFNSPDPENAGADSTNPQSWNGYSYVLNNPLTNTDPDGTDPCGTNPNCVTVNAKLDPVATVAAILLVASANVLMQTNQMAAESWNWLSQPRNGTCLSASTAAGASAGAGIGLLGLAGGPVVIASEPTAVLTGGALGWAGGLISCMSSSGEVGSSASGGGGDANNGESNSKKPPVKATKLRGNQGWRDENGNIWRKDMLHKDHWDVIDRSGNKIRRSLLMAENSGQTGPKTPTDSNFTHPYVKYEGTAIWTSLETAISDLVANGDLVEQTNRKYIVGYLCKVLAATVEGASAMSNK